MKLFENKRKHVITYEKHDYLTQKKTSYLWKLKHIRKHVMETKLELYLHELNPQGKISSKRNNFILFFYFILLLLRI